MFDRQSEPQMMLVARNVKGFTLIELMIVLAIIGIIAAIAYPSYQDKMRETRRSDAYTALTRMADLQERFYLQNRTYTTDVTQLGGATSPEGFYNLTVTAADSNTYTLRADVVATGPQVSDTGCLSLLLNQGGQKTPANCWK